MTEVGVSREEVLTSGKGLEASHPSERHRDDQSLQATSGLPVSQAI